MPRMTLPEAALAVLLAAWSAQTAHADGGPAARDSAPSPSASSSAGSAKPKIITPWSKLKQLATGSKVQPAAHAAPAKVAVKADPRATASARAHTANYSDDNEVAEELPAPPARPALQVPPNDNPPAQQPPTQTAPAPAPVPGGPTPAFPGGPAPRLPALPSQGPAPIPGLPPAVGNASPAYAPLPGRPSDPGVAMVPGYPYLHAPLNPCPVPHVPHQVGSAMVTNQALYPQEMLYAHKYRALYPPFYYKVRGHWMVTPWGVWSNDHWELQGTEVKVNYRSSYSPLSLFTPPLLR